MPAAKKPASKAKAAAKRPAVKRAPAKSQSATSVKRVSTAPAPVRSFRPAKPDEPFFTFRITHQTIYWLILAVIVVSLAAWVLSISIRVQKIYDQIDAAERATENIRLVPKAR